MNLTEKKDFIMIFIAILWIVLWGLAITNHYVIAMQISILLMFLHLILGTSHNDKINKKLLIYPFLSWIVLWIIGFYLAYINSVKTYDDIRKHLFLGFHPSFGPVVYLYWIGGMLTLAVGFYLKKDCWLSQEQWDSFKEEINKIKREKEDCS